jgi:outer membrane lipoprotein LolB
VNLPTLRRNYLVLFVLSLLSGVACTSLPERGPVDGGFHLRGKLGVVQGDESFSARFLWRQERADFTIDLWGPLGQGHLQLSGSERYLELRDGDGAVISAGSPEDVMDRHLGWSLPLDVLPQWVRGKPAPNLPVTARTEDAQGRLAAFTQLGWAVELERYQVVAQGTAATALPHRVTARRGNERVRLAISDWEI